MWQGALMHSSSGSIVWEWRCERYKLVSVETSTYLWVQVGAKQVGSRWSTRWAVAWSDVGEGVREDESEHGGGGDV